MVTIAHKEWTDGGWLVVATIETPGATRAGAHVVDLPEHATDAELKAAILAMYQ